ncbi:MAG: SH3 domain-containing protein [Bacteroidales bacterium]|nr:SH3 domain-containing protein [Bacteroidales bacterium]
MKSLTNVFLFSVLFFLCACKADIQKLYNDGDSFQIEFESCIPRVKEFVFQPIEGNKCYFEYNKNTHTAYLNLNDAERRHKKCDNIVYNALLSDQNHLCLQDDYYRFVIENAGSAYIMHLYVFVYKEWKCVAMFTQNESDNIVPAVEFKDVLNAQSESNEASEMNSLQSKEAELDEHGGLKYRVVRGNSPDGFVSIRKEKASKSKELGRLYNEEDASYIATEGERYKIDLNGIVGYVYSKYATMEIMVDP